MFIEALILAIIIGFIVRGKLENLQYLNLKGINFVFLAFLIEAVIMLLIRNHILEVGSVTYIINFCMYILIFYFIYLNRSNKYIVIMGVGFLLNAITIFLNGGSMPVSQKALEIASLNYNNVENEGLYHIINSNTRLAFLGDIIPKTILRNFVVSIGDIISCIGMMLLIITGMKKNQE